MFWYLMQTIYLCQVCIRWINIFNYKKVDGYYELGLVPLCIQNETSIYEFSGFSLQWLIVEIILFMNFLLTMFLLIVRAKFMNLRKDYLYCFKPEYLAITVNQLIDRLRLKLNISVDKRMQEKKFIGHQFTIRMHFREIHITIDQRYFDRIWEKKVAQDNNYVDKDEVEEFMRVNMGITRAQLVLEKLSEINSLDMMAPHQLAD